jgi:hypothetical protein
MQKYFLYFWASRYHLQGMATHSREMAAIWDDGASTSPTQDGYSELLAKASFQDFCLSRHPIRSTKSGLYTR